MYIPQNHRKFYPFTWKIYTRIYDKFLFRWTDAGTLYILYVLACLEANPKDEVYNFREEHDALVFFTLKQLAWGDSDLDDDDKDDEDENQDSDVDVEN